LVIVAQWRLVVASSIEVPGVGGAPRGAADVEMIGAGPLLGGSTRDLLHDLVVHDTSASIPGNATLGDVALALESSSTMSLGVSGVYLSGSPGSPPPPTYQLENGGG
jgi:hypothetical protein